MMMIVCSPVIGPGFILEGFLSNVRMAKVPLIMWRNFCNLYLKKLRAEGRGKGLRRVIIK